MEMRPWHWMLALALASSLHLLPFLWLGGGSGGEGEGRPFEGMSVVLQPLPDPTPAPDTDPTSLPAAATADPVVAPAVEAAPEPSELPSQITAAGESGAVVIADVPLQPLAGGLELAPSSTTLETPPLVAETNPTVVDASLAPDTVGVVNPSITPPATPLPEADTSANPGDADLLVDQGPLLGAAQPLPQISDLVSATPAESLDSTGLPAPGAAAEIIEASVGEQGEVLAVAVPPSAIISTPVASIPTVNVSALDAAGEEEAPEAVDAGDGDEGVAIQPTPPPPAMAVPPPPGGDTIAPSVSTRSEAVLPAGPDPGGSVGPVLDTDTTVVTPITPAPTETNPVAPEQEQQAEDVTLAEEAPLPLPAVEMQSRPAPARSWADMMPSQLAARLPASGPTGQGEIPERGDVPGLVVDGALSGGEATARGRYLASVQGWLARHRHYPHQARQAGLEGQARLHLTLNRFGEIQSYEFLQRTGHPLLDRAVEALLKQAAPLPSMPGFLADDQISTVVTISYRLDE